MGKVIITERDWQTPEKMPRFQTCYADPPWETNQRGKYGAANHYNLMQLEDIKAMPVSQLMDDNAHLWLWVPNGLIQEGLDVIKAWGFTYRNSFYWIRGKLSLGVYLRTASETCLFATRGKAPARVHNQQNWLFAPTQEHSRKPEEMYNIITRFSPGPYLELFCRHRPKDPDWSCYGDETEGGADIWMPGQIDMERSKEYMDRLGKQIRGEA